MNSWTSRHDNSRCLWRSLAWKKRRTPQKVWDLQPMLKESACVKPSPFPPFQAHVHRDILSMKPSSHLVLRNKFGAKISRFHGLFQFISHMNARPWAKTPAGKIQRCSNGSKGSQEVGRYHLCIIYVSPIHYMYIYIYTYIVIYT